VQFGVVPRVIHNPRTIKPELLTGFQTAGLGASFEMNQAEERELSWECTVDWLGFQKLKVEP
jgi:hypothetical protein